ncbi:hypothetical protein ACM01_12760 [Streptomyces viridochromogenes]|uniref:Uncharacterized protein n=1 Tax=Streptomyces viridochromogenes TaxID=1938 RepID=A0A0J7ZI12_STRVR|nr:hypothetical protein [Streptomyces viridochromogenes]KMS74788.1 hypothetical protein ACM01_12760 [Streptomyces viridochromogenes]KOG14847.1 hypothetical protein ADK36_30305 [Streptomyces viridochromogenes]KOG15041.1 hypothetical protein ADK35_29950 [Streptomyces viridochromogenes]
MRQGHRGPHEPDGPHGSVPLLLPFLVTAGVSLAGWAAWLGWDQHRDVQPDGSTTGPYEAWQVIGLVLTLLVPVSWAAWRHVTGAVLGTTAGLTVAACYDWSDDASGLYGVGVGMVMLGTFAVTAALSAVISSVIAPRIGRPG